MKGKKETKFANHDSIHSLQAYLFFLAKIQASARGTPPPAFRGQGYGGGCLPTGLPSVATTPELLAGLFCLPRGDQGVGLGLRRPSQGKDLSGSWKERGARELGGCPWSCFSRRDGFPGTSRPLSTPGFRRFQQQSFLKKMLVMATAPANSGQTLAHQPGPSGRRRGGARPGRVGLGGEPGHSLLLRWPGCKLRWLPGLS